MESKRKQERCEFNSQTVSDYARRFPRGHWSFLGPGSEEKWYGTHTNRPDGSWSQSAENMMANFTGSSHPVFRASSAFERGELRSKEGGKKSIHLAPHSHFCKSAQYLPKISGLGRNLQPLIVWERQKFLAASLLQKTLPMHSNGNTSEGEAYLRRNKSTENSKFEALDSHAECR